MRLSNTIIDRIAGALRLEQQVIESDTGPLLRTITYIGTKKVFEYDLDLEPLYQAFKKRLDEDDS